MMAACLRTDIYVYMFVSTLYVLRIYAVFFANSSPMVCKKKIWFCSNNFRRPLVILPYTYYFSSSIPVILSDQHFGPMFTPLSTSNTVYLIFTFISIEMHYRYGVNVSPSLDKVN